MWAYLVIVISEKFDEEGSDLLLISLGRCFGSGGICLFEVVFS